MKYPVAMINQQMILSTILALLRDYPGVAWIYSVTID